MAVAVHQMRAHKRRFAPGEQGATERNSSCRGKEHNKVLSGRSSLGGGELILVGPERRERTAAQRSDLHYTGSIPSLYFVAIFQVLYGRLSVLRLRRLKIATNGKAAGVIANRKSLKTIVGVRKEVGIHRFLTS